jgi:hypothetical protein
LNPPSSLIKIHFLPIKTHFFSIFYLLKPLFSLLKTKSEHPLRTPIPVGGLLIVPYTGRYVMVVGLRAKTPV